MSYKSVERFSLPLVRDTGSTYRLSAMYILFSGEILFMCQFHFLSWQSEKPVFYFYFFFFNDAGPQVIVLLQTPAMQGSHRREIRSSAKATLYIVILFGKKTGWITSSLQVEQNLTCTWNQRIVLGDKQSRNYD